ncbi:succinate CoA transferase [Rhizobiaceae bacterium BDR2-2]|uniref:Succinate CoA transferase n=1 Tax=Ectorhizobium quercum TaxID=2965071 RepID=A0AAE3STE2_9HYPH|nr:succinate CoA transferase [Ectorhizobium quercum]MCX8995857.1 succinate CoA transferase [Ectorhizobium quercum]
MLRDRVRRKALLDKVVSAEEAASLVKNGSRLGMSGFTRAGEAKVVPPALVERAKNDGLKIELFTGASLGNDMDGKMAAAHLLTRRSPFQADPVMRKAINNGEIMFVDQHLSLTAESMRAGQIRKVDTAVIEACAITEEGYIVPTSSVGNSATFALDADQIIVELNLAHTDQLEGMHDVYIPEKRPNRTPIQVSHTMDRIGVPYFAVDPSKISAIVETNIPDSPANNLPPDDDTAQIAGHLLDFLKNEVKQGRLTNALRPLQCGIGTIANAVLSGFQDSPFHDLEMFSEVLQDSTFELFDSGKLLRASTTSFSLSAATNDRVMSSLADFKDKIILRPQEISNNPEISRRLGLICINTALEFDIYGNVNSTHVGGTHMMNGIGGSGDFARSGQMSIFVTKSIAKDGKVSSIVPMVAHVDHSEHDVAIVATEIGLADLRGLAPRERAPLIIKNCVHPLYRDLLTDYYERAVKRGGHTPHVLEEALSWHVNLASKGTMLL